MSTAACKNKGFILDGYPRTMNDAKHIFLEKIDNYHPPLEGEQHDPNDAYPGYKVDESMIP